MKEKATPKNNNLLLSLLVIGGLFLVLIILVISAQSTILNPSEDTKNPIITQNYSTQLNSLNDFSVINSQEDFITFKNNYQRSSNTYFGGPLSFRSEELVLESAVFSDDSSAGSSVSSKQSESYVSSTNNQIQSVDEADIVKLNEKYTFVIPNTYSSESIEIIALEENGKLNQHHSFEYSIDDEQVIFNKMLLSEDSKYLFAIGRIEHLVPKISEYDYSISHTYEQESIILKIDISNIDSKEFEVVDEMRFSHQIGQARLFDETLYITLEEYSFYSDVTPFLRVSTPESQLIVDEIRYIIPPMNPKTLTLGAISTNDFDNNSFESFLIESYATLYVNENSAIIVYKNNQRVYEEERKEVAIQILSKYVSDLSDISSEEFIETINELLITGTIGKETVEKINEEIQEELQKLYLENYKSTILRFEIDEIDLSFAGENTFRGEILNQFSIDEYKGVTRVAVKVNDWRIDEERQSGVVTFDEDMEVLDTLYGIAPNENMYSARFVGERLYMVTFEQIDPLFVINLSNPSDITIEGELKIPGFSEYLHPYKNGLLIGIGKETELTKDDRVVQDGVKISLFDVSDVNNPKEVDVKVFGDSWGEALVAQDHKAFLLDEKREFMVVPMYFRKDDDSYDYWYGAKVIDLSNGELDEITELEHDFNKDEKRRYWYDERILRSAFVDDTLYTYSSHYIKSHDISNEFEDVDYIEIENNEPEYEIYY